MKFFLSVLAFVFCFAGCKNKPATGKSKSFSPDVVFCDYRVEADEEENRVTVRLQFRSGDEEGTPLRLTNAVTFDGDSLQADSAGFTGVFYEASRPLDDFAGTHRIAFIDLHQKKHAEEFSFELFGIATELPEQLKKEPFNIKLTGFSTASAKVQLVLVDTSFSSADVNEEVWVENGELKIDSSFLSNLSSGPITMEIVKEDEKPLGDSSGVDGRISLTYRLRCQFEFVD